MPPSLRVGESAPLRWQHTEAKLGDRRDDAELLQAWQAYLAAYRAMMDDWDARTQDGLGDVDAELEERCSACEERVLALPARGIEGAIIKLRMLVLRECCSFALHDHYAYGQPFPSEDELDLDDRSGRFAAGWIAFDLVCDLEAVTGFRS